MHHCRSVPLDSVDSRCGVVPWSGWSTSARVHSLEKNLGRQVAHLPRILSDHCHRWIQQVGKSEVVETDQSEAVLPFGAGKGAEGAHAQKVLRREDGCGGIVQRKQLLDGVSRRVSVSEVSLHPGRLRR